MKVWCVEEMEKTDVTAAMFRGKRERMKRRER